MIHMGTVTPHDVSHFVTFDRSNPEWCYHSIEDSMFDKQAEGVAHVWNLLSEKKVAVLADEVGMGKTLQALSVCALLWRIKPDVRILVISPREVVVVNWQNEFQDRDGKVNSEAIARVLEKTDVREIPQEDIARALYFGRRMRERVTSAFFGHPGIADRPFDLLIVDEAHYYRNRTGGSLRANAAAGFFGNDETGRIADRMLLLTATPNHTSLENRLVA